MSKYSGQFVGRAGEKLSAALDAFGLDVSSRVCADFGCNVGGFTDCLLQRGAQRLYAVDTGYGALAWTLRNDPRVVVMERTNALHLDAPEGVDLVVVDVAWTPQERIVPAAMRWLKAVRTPSCLPCVVSLLKPHYELAKMRRGRPGKSLTDAEAHEVCAKVCSRLAERGFPVHAATRSCLRGKGGNLEFLLMIV